MPTSTVGLFKRITAMLYDTLLVAALWLLTLFIAVLVDRQVNGQPQSLEQVEPAAGPWFGLVLLAVTYGFFCYFWVKHGATLGMQTWRIRVQTPQGELLSLKQASIRFFAAILSIGCLGLGYLWLWIDKDGLTWHDRLSNSRLVLVAKTS